MTHPVEPWTASISALGPITQKTLLTVDAIAPLLPGYELELFPGPEDASENPFILARRHGTQTKALKIIGHRETNAVVTVRVYEDGRIPNAFMIGSTLSETLLKPDRCFRSEGPFRDFVTCDMQEEPWLLYWITSDEIAAHPPGKVPPDNVLARGEIRFISWIPWRSPDETAT